METEKQLGIWMDHAEAHLMELKNDTITTHKVGSDFTHQQREETLSKSENVMHNKEQHVQHGYYKKISEAIKEFKNVVIFGPTTAKSELFNLLKADPHFEKTRIEVQSTDKLTQHQQEAFVRNYFHLQLK